MSLHELVAALEEVPTQDEPMFPFVVRALSEEFGAEVMEACQDLLNMSDTEVRAHGSSDPGMTRFLALYISLLINWRRLNFQRYRELVDQYDGDFPEDRYPYFLTFRSQYYASRGEDREDLALALDCAREAMRRLPRGPAVLNLYTSTIVKVRELGGEMPEEQLSEAEGAISEAIRIDRELFALKEKADRFAAYHATKARLLTLRGRHQQARLELHRALDLANPAETGRLAEFLEIRGQIALNQRLSAVSTDLEALRRRIEAEAAELRDLGTTVGDQMRTQAVQLLGLLAAVLAFLFTATEIARQLAFDEAAKLMLVVSGSILVVFAGFSLIFYAERLSGYRAGAALMSAGIGGGLVATGLLI